MRVVYCQFSTVANNVGVRIWDAKPDHYLGLFNGQFRFSENLMCEKKFAKVTFAESLLWSVYNFPNYLLCNKKYSCRLQLCLTNTEFLPSRITVSLFFGKTFTMPTNGSKERTAVHTTPSNHRKQYPVHKQLSWNFLRIRKVINTQFRL